MIQYVPDDPDKQLKEYKNTLLFFLEKCVQMNELSKHSDYLSRCNNSSHVFKYIQSDVWEKTHFNVRYTWSKLQDTNYVKMD